MRVSKRATTVDVLGVLLHRVHQYGVYVVRVWPDTPAHAAGLQAGDMVWHESEKVVCVRA